MPEVVGANGLRYYDLTNIYGHGVPQWPSAPALDVHTTLYHSKDGVFVQQVSTIMHRSTHMDAPIHVTENGGTLTDYEPWRFFGTGVAVSIPKGKWGVITPHDLEHAEPRINRGDILVINTGSHKLLGDNDAYYAYSPGLYKEAAEWIVERGVKMVGVDVQALDHPLGTKLADHGPGPSHAYLNDEYRQLTGRDIKDDFRHWEPAHKIMMGAGIPGIENVGGDLDLITGKRCTFMAFPWRWAQGDGCVVRLIAITNPNQAFRIERGLRDARDAR